VETVNHILENGVSVNSRVALRGSDWTDDEYLISELGDRRNVTSDRTALTVAAWNGHFSVVYLLLDRGAEIQIFDVNGAVYNRHYEVVDLLLRHHDHYIMALLTVTYYLSVISLTPMLQSTGARGWRYGTDEAVTCE
jgi:hypothetical protein